MESNAKCQSVANTLVLKGCHFHVKWANARSVSKEQMAKSDVYNVLLGGYMIHTIFKDVFNAQVLDVKHVTLII